MSTIRNGVEQFLNSRESSSPYLIPKWSPDLESQFNVYSGNVEVEPGSKCWTDGTQTWASHRWPYNSGTNPQYSDKQLKFSPDAHMERIGSTWWNWETKKSVAVAFDIDMEGDGHAASTTTVTETELKDLVARLKKLPYVSMVRSTGGNGVHLYVFFDEDHQPEAANHNEHNQVAFATLAKMSEDAGYDFAQHMDAKGVILWFWAASSPDGHAGFNLIHEASKNLKSEEIKDFRLQLLPRNNRSKIIKGFDDEGNAVESETDDNGYKKHELEEEHKEILKELEELDYDFIWHDEFNMVHTNTRALRELFQKRAESKPLKGIFESTSEGHVRKPNCFMTPRPGGAFQVKRFGSGIGEHPTWDSYEGDTWCYYNQDVSVSTVFKNMAADGDGQKFTFQPAKLEEALKLIGPSLGDSLTQIDSNIIVTRKNDGTFYATFTGDGNYPGWRKTKHGQARTLPVTEKVQVRITTVLDDVDQIARFLVTPQFEPYGYALNTSLGWIMHSSYDGISATITHRFPGATVFVKNLLATNPWVMDNVPFGPEYSPPREIKRIEVPRLWNLRAPQFSIEPASEATIHPHWDMVYEHLGQSLDLAVRSTKWCQEWGLATGADYLRFWMASLIQYPFESLPYLFFYGPQDSGKSIFHESASMLFSYGTVESITGALTNTSGFNYEISNCMMGHIEEKNLDNVRDTAYTRLKEWITSIWMSIIKKGETPYSQRNTIKIVHMANKPTACPMEDGDTRITVFAVPVLGDKLIPRVPMRKQLIKEAPAFLRTLLTTHIPESPDRLRVPMLRSQDKADLESMNQEPWEAFAADTLFPCNGEVVKFVDFYQAYITFCTCNNQEPMKSKKLLQMVRNRGDKYIVGIGKNKTVHIANVSMNKDATPVGPPLVLTRKGRLVQCTE